MFGWCVYSGPNRLLFVCLLVSVCAESSIRISIIVVRTRCSCSYSCDVNMYGIVVISGTNWGDFEKEYPQQYSTVQYSVHSRCTIHTIRAMLQQYLANHGGFLLLAPLLEHQNFLY